MTKREEAVLLLAKIRKLAPMTESRVNINETNNAINIYNKLLLNYHEVIKDVLICKTCPCDCKNRDNNRNKCIGLIYNKK